MAKSFENLRKRMTPQQRARSAARASELIAEIALQDLRKSLKITQEELARLLDMKQAGISRLERQEDMYISTLSRVVSALGGRLKLIASFPDREVEINQLDRRRK